MGKRQSDKELLRYREAAKDGAREVLNLQRQQRNLNLYRTTERLLRNYKTYQKLVNDLDGYGFEPIEKSHDISVAPPPGSGVSDRVNLYDEHIAARRASYERTKARFDEIDAVVKQFQDKLALVEIEDAAVCLAAEAIQVAAMARKAKEKAIDLIEAEKP